MRGEPSLTKRSQYLRRGMTDGSGDNIRSRDTLWISRASTQKTHCRGGRQTKVPVEFHPGEETVEIFVEADFETHATVADLLSSAVMSWRKTLSFSILA
jgi:hypothetical protein